MHVDDFIATSGTEHPYARFVLHLFRLSAMLAAIWRPWTKQFLLFCEYEGRRYRVIGASRMGDVWLTSRFDRDTGYEHRVDVDACSNWGAAP